ncbi:MAG: hypothetical protein ACYCV4_04385 [Dermatophilaceae bacterium]
MIVDCMTCPVRGQRCDDCVVTVLLALGSTELPLDVAERRAVSTFVGAGLASAETAAGLFARHEPMESVEHWGVADAVG